MDDQECMVRSGQLGMEGQGCTVRSGQSGMDGQAWTVRSGWSRNAVPAIGSCLSGPWAP